MFHTYCNYCKHFVLLGDKEAGSGNLYMTTMVQLCGYKVLLINLLYTCQINGPSTLKLNFHGYTYSSDTDDTTVAKLFEESKNTL